MIKLNLVTDNEEHEIIKAYLEENASKILANKINNGVKIEKDEKTFINKKTLEGFMKYATDEARKIAEKGKNYKAVHHDTVFAWAIHYFEEDSIEETLYNEDGSEYKPVKQTKSTPTPVKKPSKPTQSQYSLFDLMNTKTTDKDEITDAEEDDEEPTQEEIQEAMEELKNEEKPKGSPVYTRYVKVQEQYPDCIVAYRLGDFYEVFGENAKKVSNELDLTLTGRDCGLDERIPMVGFPYHCADNYFDKILKFSKLAIVEQNEVIIKTPNLPKNIDYETGEVFDLSEEEMREFDGDIYEPNDLSKDVENDDDELMKTVENIDKDIMLKLYELLDGKLDIR